MKTLNCIFGIFLITIFSLSAGAQDHTTHHPDHDDVIVTENSPNVSTSKRGKKGNHDWCVTDKQIRNMKMGAVDHLMVFHQVYHTIYHLSDMKGELKLSNKQIVQLTKISNDFQKRDATWQALIEKNQFDLDLKVRNNASVDEVKKYFQAISVTKIEKQSSAYETSQKMLSILSPNQKDIWENISSEKSCCGGTDHVHMSHMMKIK
jgi:hypothetical protein